MRGFRRRQRLWRDKAGGEEKKLSSKVFSSPPAINHYNTAKLFIFGLFFFMLLIFPEKMLNYCMYNCI